jgi:hypothetical protein
VRKYLEAVNRSQYEPVPISWEFNAILVRQQSFWQSIILFYMPYNARIYSITPKAFHILDRPKRQ